MGGESALALATGLLFCFGFAFGILALKTRRRDSRAKREVDRAKKAELAKENDRRAEEEVLGAREREWQAKQDVGLARKGVWRIGEEVSGAGREV